MSQDYNINSVAEDKKLSDLKNKRREYKSLDEFSREEGVEAVLIFLASNPTVIGDKYKGSKMNILPYTVERWNR